MTDKSFEKQISDKLNQFEIQPSEGMLESIFAKRAAKPARFAGIPYSGLMLAALVISIAAVSLVLWNSNKGNNAAVIASSENNNKTENVNPPAISQNQNSVKESNTNSSYSDIESIKSTQVKPAQEKANKSNKASNTRKEYAATGKELENENVIARVPAKESKPTNNIVSGKYDFNEFFNYQSKNKPSIAREVHKGNTHLYVYETMGDQDIANAGFLYSNMSRPDKMPIVTPEFESNEKTSIADAKEKKEVLKKNPVFIDLLFTPTLNIAGTKGKGNIQQVSNAMSKANYNSQFGIRVSVPVSKQFSVFTGLFMRNQSNHYKGSLNYQENAVRIDETITYINDPNGGVIKQVSYDTVNYTASNTQNINFKNTYSMVQLPLGFSYNFGHGKFDFAFHGSALINVFRNSNGHSLNLIEHNTSSYSSNKTFVGLGAGLSWMAAYKISPKFRLIMEPGVQYFGINALKVGNNIKEKSFSPQISVGLRYTVF